MMQGNRVAQQRSLKNKGNRMGKDIISTMPNEIIAIILSQLTIKEAGRTSILSTRWRYLWTYFFGVLNFDHSLKIYNMRRHNVPPLKKCISFVSEWESFTSILEHVLKSLRSPSMQGLRICIDMGNPGKIAEWVKFAAEKDVQMLELDCSYHFTLPFYEISQTIRNVLSSTSFEMKSLCVLRLVSVDVSGEVIQYFLASCPYLETLLVRDSKLLVRLKVCGHGLRLKHLELVECNILYLDIYAENLMTFSYLGDYGKFNFECIPSLVEASFGGRYASYLQSNMDDIDVFALFSQLHVLKLELCVFDETILQGLPEFTNVKHLELLIPHGCGTELDRPISLLSAFPSIFVLKVKFQRYKVGPPPELEWNANLELEFPNLKELHVSGCRRDPSQIEFLVSISENAPNLNKIVVDPVSAFHVSKSPEVKARIRELRRDSTIWFVDGLKPYAPPLVELIVL